MARHHAKPSSLVRRLRPSPERFAAAAALQDPSLLLQLQAAHPHGERPISRTQSPRPIRRRPGLRSAIRGALTGERRGALLLAAAGALALLWSNSPWQATSSAFWHAPIALTIGPWTLGADLRTWIDEGAARQFRARGDSTAALIPLSVC